MATMMTTARRPAKKRTSKKPLKLLKPPKPSATKEPAAPDAESAPDKARLAAIVDTAYCYKGAPKEEYASFYEKLSNPERLHLRDTGVHDEIKASLKQ